MQNLTEDIHFRVSADVKNALARIAKDEKLRGPGPQVRNIVLSELARRGEIFYCKSCGWVDAKRVDRVDVQMKYGGKTTTFCSDCM